MSVHGDTGRAATVLMIEEERVPSNGQPIGPRGERQAGMGDDSRARFDRVLWFSLLSSICGCSCVGIVAVIHAVRVSV
ncbi:hypothetical protein chiPu_0033696 [Chiloscyllium punctatum]|uniref:Uncharacterized protein n=1 Tax=Chiloscyllium punctatum TaxID=137246 RepID=A0A401U3P9_CHIPU|nr:hypothetical protein [Chiloscyllium punctatum]